MVTMVTTTVMSITRRYDVHNKNDGETGSNNNASVVDCYNNDNYLTASLNLPYELKFLCYELVFYID